MEPKVFQKNITVRHPLDPFQGVKVEKLCPKCHSVFVTKERCESCGYQFWVNLLGSPFGERSFFELKSDYLSGLRFGERFLPQKIVFSRKKHKRFLRSLKRRFEVLAQYFFNSLDQNQGRRKLFLLEIKSLIEAFGARGGDLNLLWREMEDRSDKHPFFVPISQALQNEERRRQEALRPFWKRFLEFQFFGHLRALFFLKAFVFYGALIFLALFTYPYLLAL